MNRHMIVALMRKDLHFFHKQLVGYALTGSVAIGVLCLPGNAAFYLGGVFLVSILTTLGMHLPIAVILGERRNQTLPLVLSLPITARDYTLSKMAVCLLSYLAVWLLLSALAVAAIWLAGTRPHGLIPFMSVVLVGCVVNAVLVLASALVRDSLDKTVRAVIFWSLVLQATVYFAATNPALNALKPRAAVLWSPDALAYLGAEGALIAFGLCATWALQARKTQLI